MRSNLSLWMLKAKRHKAFQPNSNTVVISKVASIAKNPVGHTVSEFNERKFKSCRESQ